MRFSMLSIFVFTVCVSMVSAENGFLTNMQLTRLEKAGCSSPSVLAKTSKTMALTQYLNPSVNLAFECPTGWTITDTFGLPGICLITVTNPFRLASVTIFACKENTFDEASRFGPTDCFWDDWQSSKMSIYVPFLYYVYDSTINNISYAHNQVKDKDASNNVTHVRTRFTQSNTLYYHSMYYRTTITDFNTNETSYSSNWNNLLFISISTVAKSQAINSSVPRQLALVKSSIIINLDEQQRIKLLVFDIRGRMLKQLYSGNLEGQKEFETGRLTPPYIINLKAHSSESKLVMPMK